MIAAVSMPNAVPQGYITQLQAAAACSGAGKRLCTDAEWLRASPGPSLPSRTRTATRAHAGRVQRRAFGASGDRALRHERELDLQPHRLTVSNQLQPGLDLTGANAGCRTAEGVFDMMGNLHEWTADPAGTFRGGFYVDTVINGNGCLYDDHRTPSRTGTTRPASAAARTEKDSPPEEERVGRRRSPERRVR